MTQTKQGTKRTATMTTGMQQHERNVLKLRLKEKAGFGINEVIGIAAGIIIAVVVVIPGLQGFAGDILDNLTNWWNNMASSVFATP
jgi:hypothetical protein